MSLAIRDSASRVADAARGIGGDIATALAWLEAARGDISRNRPSASHAPDAVRVPAAGAVHESEWRRAAGDLVNAAPALYAMASIRFVAESPAA